MKSRGYILFEGPSALDGAPIAVIAIVESSNAKTGNMVQTYIIRTDIDPVTAARTGADASICGQCIRRPYLKGTQTADGATAPGDCYVTLFRGPLAVFKAYKAGNYPRATMHAGMHFSPELDAPIGAGRLVRFGSYGDPAAAPVETWQALADVAIGHTGYSHQWRAPHAQALRELVMASADSQADADLARSLGWRYFRVTDTPVLNPREFSCPASAEAGKVRTCATCKACNGAPSGSSKASPVIVAHGPRVARRTIPILATA